MVYLVMAFMKAVCLDPIIHVINRTFIRNQHDIFEKYILKKILKTFSSLNIKVITVNWGTKLLQYIN